MSDDQLIIPAHEEAASEGRAQEVAERQQFLAQFSLDDMPFCPEGMALLFRLAKHRPSLYEMARQRGFADFIHPAFAMNADAQALAHHVDACHDCNESGTASTPYKAQR